MARRSTGSTSQNTRTIPPMTMEHRSLAARKPRYVTKRSQFASNASSVSIGLSGELSPDQRALVVDYYREAGPQKIAARRDLARRLGITMNALGIRACRIRAALEARVKACSDEP